MTEIEITINGASSTAKKSGILTSGMVGVPVSFNIDEHWNGLSIIPVFRCGDVIKDNILLDNRTTVPHEVLESGGHVLYVGAEGRTTDGKLVIPTIWARVGTVQCGAKATGDLGLEPTPSQFDRFMEEVGKIDSKVTDAVTEVVKSGALKGEKGDTGATGPQGLQGEKGDTGATGAAGADGKDGISITVKSVSESTADGGSNVVTFSDGKTVTVKNGSKGDKGDKGDTGAQGIQGPRGYTGETGATGPQGPQGEKGETGATGPQGPQGEKGETGATGASGYTPVKGTDYFTDADKAELVETVLAALPVYSGEVV